MRKTLTILTLFLTTHIAVGQTVIHGSDIIDGELKPGYYLLLKIDSKALTEEWKDYVDGYGRVSEPEQGRHTVSKFRQRSISDEDLKIESKISAFEDFSKLFCVVEGVSERNFNERAFDDFLLDFAQEAQYRELVRLAALDLEEAENYLEDNEREQKRIERSLESNLKYQERYGKYLDESPEEMVSLMEEKKSLSERQVSDQLDEEAIEEVSKAARRTDREIAKNERKAKKYAKRLQKKETEFDGLRNELFDVKRAVATAEELVSTKKMVFKDLKK